MELSHSISMTVLLGLFLLTSKNTEKETVSDLFQDSTKFAMMACFILEYLLLLTYIGVAAYDFFKNRKMMKKMNVQRRTYEFLKFDESHRDVGNRWHDSDPGHKEAIAAKLRVAKNLKRIRLKSLDNPSLCNQPHSNIEGARGDDLRIVSDNPSTNNPQLLKFDGESAPPPVEMKEIKEREGNPGKMKRVPMRERNKSLKRKQIE